MNLATLLDRAGRGFADRKFFNFCLSFFSRNFFFV